MTMNAIETVQEKLTQAKLNFAQHAEVCINADLGHDCHWCTSLKLRIKDTRIALRIVEAR